MYMTMATIITAVFLVALTVMTSPMTSAHSDEENDWSELLVPPSGATVKIGGFLKCVRYKPEDSELTSLVWLRMSWRDKRMAWNPDDRNGTRERLMSQWGQMWMPDIVALNGVDWIYPSSYSFASPHVTSDGYVMLIAPVRYITSCRNGHRCQINLGSWSYDGRQMPLSLLDDGTGSNVGLDLSEYEDACPWTVSSPSATINNIKYACCPDVNYPRAELSFNVARAD